MEDIKPLLVFAAVLEQGSMNAAAQTLGMTPSAVSQHITRLEKLHQVKLLNRSTRKLTPTDAGLALSQYCTRLRHTLADTQQVLENLKTEAAGEVHIALPSTLVHAPAFQIALAQLHAQFPNIQPKLHLSENLLNLSQSSIDIALRGGDHALDAPDLIARPLCSWPWQICAAPSYLNQHPPITQPEDLYTHTWLAFLPLRHTLSKGAVQHLLNLEAHIWCDQFHAVRSLTLAGLGLSLQLSGEVHQEITQGQLCTVLNDWQFPSIHIYAVTPYRVQSAKVEVVMQALQRCFSEETAFQMA